MIKKAAFFIAILWIAVGCSNNDQNNKADAEQTVSQAQQAIVDSNVVKVYVSQDGKITADGNDISLPDLDSSFSQLKQKNGIVYYSRDNVQGEPPQESMKVMDLVVKYSLPVKMFTDKTFTVVVKPN